MGWEVASSDHRLMSNLSSTVRAVAETTPADRNRVVDLMRVVSILVVIFGHWLIAVVSFQDGELVTGHLLAIATWTHPLTWALQVMPVFFFVGGYSNALSWRSARRGGVGYGGWLRTRLRRLVLPVIPLLVVWGVGGWVAFTAGVEWGTLQAASQVALVPTWFLATYVVIVALAPPALMLWERFGWSAVGTAAALAVVVDVVSIGLGVEIVGFLNYVLVWGAVHMLGYAWVDGRIAGRRRRAALAGLGLAGLLALVVAGPYATAMVGAGTDGITNSFPPRITLLCLGMLQAGLVVLAEPILDRLAHRRAVWGGVVAVSSQIMTLYLWHFTAMILVIGASVLAGGLGLGAVPNTGTWWLTRPAWFIVLTVVTVILSLLFARFERPGPDSRPEPRAWRPVLAVVLTCLGLALLAEGGIADSDGLNALVLAAPLAGVLLGGVAGARLGTHTSQR
jgi:surface polysaccharide O-acyltransferase-like enzyme